MHVIRRAFLAFAVLCVPVSLLPAQIQGGRFADSVLAYRFPGSDIRVHLSVVAGRVIVTRGVSNDVVVDPRHVLTGAALDTVLVAPPAGSRLSRRASKDGLHLEVSPGTPVELRVQVPATTKALTIEVTDTADVFVDNFDGELEVRSARGKVEAYDVWGPVLIEAGSGSIYSTVRTLGGQGPVGAMSLLARRGDVVLGLPADASTTIDAETRRGRVLSNASLTDASRLSMTSPFDANEPIPPSTESHRSLGRVGQDGPLTRIVTLHGSIKVLHCGYCTRGTVPHR